MPEQVFMCYAREDEDFVLQLAGALKKRGVPIWIDQWDIPRGADWDQEVERALSASSHLVVVLSPASMKSPEVRGEWRAALDSAQIHVQGGSATDSALEDPSSLAPKEFGRWSTSLSVTREATASL